MDKENQNRVMKPLHNSNYQTPEQEKEKSKGIKHDFLLSVVEEEIQKNSSCSLISIILDDPLLKELNISLEKEAEQQKKAKLLESFPLRYRNLVHTQMLYKKVQSQMKQHQEQSKAVVELIQKEKDELKDHLAYLKSELVKRDEALITLKQRNCAELTEQIELANKKMAELQEQKAEQCNQMQRKMIKVRVQKENVMQFLQEMKQQCENLKKENERLIQIITQKDVEISGLNKTIDEQNKNYQNSKDNFMSQIVQTELDCSEKVRQLTQQKGELGMIADGLRVRLKQCESELINLLNEKQDMENDHFDENQELRSQLLEMTRAKNNLEEWGEMIKSQSESKIEELNQIVQRLNESLQNKDKLMRQIQTKDGESMARLREQLIRSETMSNERIRHLQQKLVEQKQVHDLSKDKIEILEGQKKELTEICDSFKCQIQESMKKLTASADCHKTSDRKSKQIEVLVGKLREQLSNFNFIIEEKEVKIQEYRKNIVRLRQKLKDAMIAKEQIDVEVVKARQSSSVQRQSKEQMSKQIEKYRQKEALLRIQLESYHQLLATQTVEKGTQFDEIEEETRSKDDEVQLLVKQMQKIKLKYQNAIQELQAYKRQFADQSIEKESLIEQLREQTSALRQKMERCMYQSSQVEKVLDVKITELKLFYQKKIQEEGGRYKDVIRLLKSQMSELYKQMDLKKSIEQQMFKDIMKLSVHHDE